MSRTHDKTQGPAQETGAPTGATDLAVVQPASATETEQIHRGEAIVPKDEYLGRGGLYRMVNGVRTRVAVTQPAATHKADAKETKQ